MRPLRDVATDFFAPQPPPAPRNLTPPINQYRQPSPSALDDLSYFYRSAKAKFSSKMREIDPLIDSYTHMQEMPDADRALHTLRKLASCVKPIMRKRGWRVGTLSEFYPEQMNLLGLNVNRGQQILVRLRYPHNHASFLPFEHTLDTMLHELCHIQIGPHDQRFHALWQELRDEWEMLTIKGYTGEGFMGNGRQIGGSLIPREEMRRRARAEAAKRDKERKAQQKNQGVRLGGARPTFGSSIHDAIAEAAIRRTSANTQAVTEGCGTGTKAGAQAAADALLNGFRTKEEMDEANAIAIQQATMELMAADEERALEHQQQTQLVAPPISDGLTWDPVHGLQAAESAPFPPRSTSLQNPLPPPIPHASRPTQLSKALPQIPPGKPGKKIPEHNRFGRPVSRLVKEAETKKRKHKSNPAQQNAQASPTTSSKTWQCDICTLINEPNASRCAACEVERSSEPSASRPASAIQPIHHMDNPFIKSVGWNCQWCGNFMENQWWTCDVCGKMKHTS